MDFAQKLDHAAAAVTPHHALIRAGENKRTISRLVNAGLLIRIRTGWYVGSALWNDAVPETQHLMAIHAARLARRSAQIFSHRSAGTLHDLPVWSDWMFGAAHIPRPDRLVTHTISRSTYSGNDSRRATLHRSACATHETTVIAGYTCTSADRTLADIAASDPFAVALACADTLLRREARVGRRIDTARVEAWRERIRELAGARRGRPGAPALRALAELAMPEAESPLESVSRLRCLQLGLEPELQVSVPSERGGDLYLDFCFREIGFFGESDGKWKYFEQEFRQGLNPDEVFEQERRRHNWISGVTGMTGVRWGAGHVVTVERFARRVRQFSVPFPGRPSTAFGPEITNFLRTTS